MPEEGVYKSKPRKESREKLIEYLNSNPVVLEVEELDYQKIRIRRDKNPDVVAFMTNIYIVGISDIHEIMSKNSDIDAIVTMSAWNSYTSEAKKFCKDIGIGLFKFKEFLGAVYYAKDRFVSYEPPEDR